jgi:hypothetical protein
VITYVIVKLGGRLTGSWFRSPRSVGARAVLASFLVLAVAGVWLAGKHLVFVPWIGNTQASDVATVLCPFLVTAALAPYVGYRRFDAFAWILPPIGFALMVRLAWRVSYLPYRDWPRRSDDHRDWVEIEADDRGRVVYVLARGDRSPK